MSVYSDLGQECDDKDEIIADLKQKITDLEYDIIQLTSANWNLCDSLSELTEKLNELNQTK